METTYSFTVFESKTTETAKDTVDQNGGTVTCEETDVEIVIPSGALEDTTVITISEVDEVPDLPDNVEGLGLKYHFGPDGLQFNSDVTVRIPYTQEDLEQAGVDDPMDLEIYYYHTSTGEWIKLEVVDADDQFVYVLVTQFCYLNLTKSNTTDVESPQSTGLPDRMMLGQNYPNPFNPETHIGFYVPITGSIQIDIYNSAGQKIRTLVDEIKPAGQYSVVWDGRDEQGHLVSSGLYFYIMRCGNAKQVRRMLFMK